MDGLDCLSSELETCPTKKMRIQPLTDIYYLSTMGSKSFSSSHSSIWSRYRFLWRRKGRGNDTCSSSVQRYWSLFDISAPDRLTETIESNSHLGAMLWMPLLRWPTAIGPCLRKLNITKSFKVSAGFRDSYAEKLAGAIWYNDGSTEKVGTSNKRSGVLPLTIEILKGARVSYSIIRHVIGWAGYRTARFLGNTAVCVEISVDPQSKQW